jgi:hypothetical protein
MGVKEIPIQGFLARLSRDAEDYLADEAMSEDVAELYAGWLNEARENLEELEKDLTAPEGQELGEILDHVYFRQYFVFGTEYGTGRGARPVLEIVRDYKKYRESLAGRENRLAYLQALETIYALSGCFQDPLQEYGFSPARQESFHPRVENLNRDVEKYSSANEQLRMIRVHERNVRRWVALKSRGIEAPEFFPGKDILWLMGFEYNPQSPQEPPSEEERVEIERVLSIVPEEEREELVDRLGYLNKVVSDNFADYQAAGSSETKTDRGLTPIWWEVEDSFYSVVDKHLL